MITSEGVWQVLGSEKRKQMKKRCILTIVISLSLFLSSCSGGQTGAGASDAGGGIDAPAAMTDSPAEPDIQSAVPSSQDEIIPEPEPLPEDKTDYDSIPITAQDYTGNNLMGGYAAVHDGRIYYANKDDEYKLYSMDVNGENQTKLSDKPNMMPDIHIQLEGDKLYYLNIVDIEDTVMKSGWTAYAMCTLYSYDLKTHKEKKLSCNNIYTYFVADGWIYYTTIEDNKLYKMKTDGKSKKMLDEGMEPMTVQLSGDRLYIKEFESLTDMNLDGKDITSYYYQPYAFYAYNNEIFSSFGGIEKNVSDDEQLFYSEEYKRNYGMLIYAPASMDIKIEDKEFNFFHQRIYYKAPDGKIYRMSINGSKPEYIADGSLPLVFSDYVFYRDKDDNLAWVANK